MSITAFNITGYTTTPGYNPVWAIATSNATAQANFEYIFDVSIEGVTFAGGATSIRLKSPADPTYGSGQVDLSPIIQPYLTGDLGDTIYGFQQCSNSIKKITVSFGELYGPSSGITAYAAQGTDTAYIFNGSLGVLEFKDYDEADYVVSGSTSDVGLMTNRPSSGSIESTYSQWVYVMAQSSGAVKFANINMYNTSGALSGTAVVINHQYHNTSASTSNRMLRFPAGWNISQIAAGSVVSGSLANFLNTTTNARWEIYFKDSSHNRVTESFFSSWDMRCTDFTIYQLYFKNKLGGYDTFIFNMARQVTADVKRSKFEKPMGSFQSATSFSYNDSDRFETLYANEFRETIKLSSDWITESQSTWLQEMITSDDVRIDVYGSTGSHYLIPVNIINTNYIQRQHRTDKIFNMEVTIQYSFVEKRQHG